MSFLDTLSVRHFRADKLRKTNLFETEQMFCDIYCLEPGQAQKIHAHADATKFYYVVEGQVSATIGAETRPLTAGGLAFSRPGEDHGVSNDSDARAVLLVAMAPNPNAT